MGNEIQDAGGAGAGGAGEKTSGDVKDQGAELGGGGALVRRRRRQVVPRSVEVKTKFSEEEAVVLRAAAAGAGVTLSSFVASRAVAHARGEVAPLPSSTGDVVRELVAQRTLLRRYVSLLNQSVAKLNATGVADGALDAVIARCDVVVGEIGGAVSRVGRR